MRTLLSAVAAIFSSAVVAGAITLWSPSTGDVNFAGLTPSTIDNMAIGNTTRSSGKFTTLSASGAVSGAGFDAYVASPPAIGGTAPAAGAFTTLSALGAVSGAGFDAYVASPPAIGGTAPSAGTFTDEVSTTLKLDTGTKTATASSGAATLSKNAGVITSEALTTAAGGTYTLTLTNTTIAAADQVFVSVGNGTNSAGMPAITSVTEAAGSLVIVVQNIHASAALNGTVKIKFARLKN